MIKLKKSNRNGYFEKDIDLSDHISARLRKMAVLERGPKDGRESSHSGLGNYAVSTPSLIENRYLNQTQLID